MNWNLAQRLPVPHWAGRIWIVPGSHVICLAEQRDPKIVGTRCVTIGDAVKHGVATTSLRDPPKGELLARRVIAGLAPDHAEAVVAKSYRKATRIPVVKGVFSVRDRALNAPESLTVVLNSNGDASP